MNMITIEPDANVYGVIMVGIARAPTRFVHVRSMREDGALLERQVTPAELRADPSGILSIPQGVCPYPTGYPPLVSLPLIYGASRRG